MRTYASYVCQPGKDFAVPESASAYEFILSDFVGWDSALGFYPLSPLCRPVPREDAEILFFPFAASRFLDTRNKKVFELMLASLNHEHLKRKICVVYDEADNTDLLDFSDIQEHICYFKISLYREYGNRAYPCSYKIPDHVLRDNPDFDFGRIQYDVSFVGNLTNDLRKFICLSVQREKNLRSKIVFDDKINFKYVNGLRHVVSKEREENVEERKHASYRKITQKSLCVLCPPGVGPQSIRFYETLFFGRIPIVLDNGIVYPFEEFIDYNKFSLVVPRSDVPRIGEVISDFISGTSRDELHEKCIQSRKVYEEWFSPAMRVEKLLGVYLNKVAAVKGKTA